MKRIFRCKCGEYLGCELIGEVICPKCKNIYWSDTKNIYSLG
jgi:hypothetical protein